MNQKNQPSWTDLHYIKFQKELDQVEGDKNLDDIDLIPLIKKIQTLEMFSPDRKRFFLLFNHLKFFPAYISNNIAEEGGHTLEEIHKGGLKFLFKHIHWKQLTLPFKVNRWGKRFEAIAGEHAPLKTEVYCCGVKFKDQKGQWRSIIIKQKMLLLTDKGEPLLSFIEAEEITPIYKVDFVWYRITNTTGNITHTRTFFSSGSKKEHMDLLTSREKEILQLIVAQKKNKEISTILNITKNTLERHRKNMIAKVGVKDMTALIYICRISKVI